MAMVQPKSQKARLFITHLLLLLFIAAIMFPLLMVVAISLRQGNFATGSLIPEQISWDHWKLALGFSVEQADGRITPPPFPVLLWLWNSVKVAGISAIGIVALSTTCAYAFARMRFPGKATLLHSIHWPEYSRRRNFRVSGRDCAACLDHQRLFRNHRQFAGRSGGAGWCDTVAGLPPCPVAAVSTDSGGCVHPVVYRCHY